jgi:hypothetical protein
MLSIIHVLTQSLDLQQLSFAMSFGLDSICIVHFVCRSIVPCCHDVNHPSGPAFGAFLEQLDGIFVFDSDEGMSLT